MERRQAAAEEAEEQGSEGSGRDAEAFHRSSSKPHPDTLSGVWQNISRKLLHGCTHECADVIPGRGL